MPKYKKNEIVKGKDGKPIIISKSDTGLICENCVFSTRFNRGYDGLPSCWKRRQKYLNEECSCFDLLPSGYIFKDLLKESGGI